MTLLELSTLFPCLPEFTGVLAFSMLGLFDFSSKRKGGVDAETLSLLEPGSIPFLVTDEEGNTLYVSDHFQRAYASLEQGEIANIFSILKISAPSQSGLDPLAAILGTVRTGSMWIGVVELAGHSLTASATLLAAPLRRRNGDGSNVLLQFAPLFDTGARNGSFERSQQRYQEIVDGALDGIVIVQDGSIVFVNMAALKVFGYQTADDLKAIPFLDLIGPASRAFIPVDFSRRFIGEEALQNYEIKGLSKDKVTLDLELNAKFISWNGRIALHASFRDITERKMLEREQALWLWEQETLSAIDRQLVGMMDLQRVMNAIANHARSLTRADFAGLLMLNQELREIQWSVLKGAQTIAAGASFALTPEIKQTIQSELPRQYSKLPGTAIDMHMLPFLESEQIVSAALFPFMAEGRVEGQLVVGFRSYHTFSAREVRLLNSLSEKSSIAFASARLYENLRLREQELEMLSAERVEAQEAERARIARELHDGLGQIMTAIKFNSEILEDSQNLVEDEKIRLQDIKSLLDNAMKETRQISYNLMPSILADFGLAPALQLLSEQFERTNSIVVQFTSVGLDDRIEPSFEVAMYRICQEALNNIAKHAGAKEVSLQIVRDAAGIRLTVEDDGKGFAPSQLVRKPGQKHGMGLVSMRERARSMKGRLTIDSTPGHGSIIILEIPIKTNG